MTYRRKAVNHYALALLVKELTQGATSAHLAEVSGLHVKTVRKFIMAMRAQGVVHVWDHAHVEGQRRPVAVYRLSLTPWEKDMEIKLSEASLETRARKARRARDQARA